MNPAFIVILLYSYVDICFEKCPVEVSSNTHNVGIAIIRKVHGTNPLFLIQRGSLFAILSSVEHGKLQKLGIVLSCTTVGEQDGTAIIAASVCAVITASFVASVTAAITFPLQSMTDQSIDEGPC